MMRSTRSTMVWFVAAASVVVSLIGLVSTGYAVPYASSISESAGTVSFILNEDSSNVTINRTGDSQLNLGPLARGAHTFSLDAATGYDIAVSSSGPEGWTQTSDDVNLFDQFERPMGVAVNQNPASSAFGRIYVSNVRTEPTASGRPMEDGIYVLGADQSDIFGNGNTALTGGLDFSASDFSSPWKLEVGPDDHLYISDWSNDSGTIYRVDADVSSQSGQVVLQGIGDQANPSVHGSISSSAIVQGTLEEGNMVIYAVDEDLSSFTSLWRWDVGSGPLPHNSEPTLVSNALIPVNGVWADVDRGTNKSYLMQNRFDGNEAGVYVVPDDNSTEVWNSLDATRELLGDDQAVDMLKQSRAVTVSPDGSQLAIITNAGDTWMIPLIDGVPDLASAILIDTFPDVNFGRDITWDAAGNFYITSSGNELLRVFSPGGSWVATTGSDGTFSLTEGGVTLLGDVNLDGVVNGLDVDPFVDVLLNGPFQTEADMNLDGVVNGLDVDPFVAAVVGGGVAAVPEPSTVVLLLLGLVGLCGYRRKLG